MTYEMHCCGLEGWGGAVVSKGNGALKNYLQHPRW